MRVPSRSTTILLVLAGLFLTLLAGAVWQRSTIASALIRSEFEQRGLDARFRLTRLSIHEAEFQDIAIDDLRIAKMQLQFSPLELMSGTIESVFVDGLEMVLDFGGNGPVLGSLQTLLSESGPGVGTTEAMGLPQLTFRQAQLEVRLREHIVYFTADGEALPAGDGRTTTSATFDAVMDDLNAHGEIAAILSGALPLSAELQIVVMNDAVTLRADLQTASDTLAGERPDIRWMLDAEGELAALASYLPISEAWHPQTGRFQTTMAGTTAMPLSTSVTADLISSEASFQISFDDVTLPVQPGLPEWLLDNFAGNVSGAVELKDGILVSALNAGVRYSGRETAFMATLPASSIVLDNAFSIDTVSLMDIAAHAMHLPTPYGVVDDLELMGSFAGPIAAPAGEMRVRASSQALNLQFAAADSARIDAVLTFTANPVSYRFDLSAPANLTAGELRIPSLLPLEDLSVEIAAARLDLQKLPAGWSFDHRATLRVPRQNIRIDRLESDPVAIVVASGPVALRVFSEPGQSPRFAADAVVDAANFPAAELTVLGTHLILAGDARGDFDANISGGSLLHDADMPLIAPLTPNLEITRRGSLLNIGGQLQGANNALLVDVRGLHNLVDGRGKLSLGIAELLLGPGHAAGVAISPLLDGLERLSGGVHGGVELAWSPNALNNSGSLELANLSFERQGVAVEGLEMSLVLDRLVPAQSPPGQWLTVRRLGTGAGVDATNIDLRFMLVRDANNLPQVQTESLAMDVAGGRITAAGGTIDPVTGEASLPLTATGLDLAQLFERLGLDGLSGQGRLNGTLPLRLTGGGAAIEGGSLQAESDGIVAYRSGEARQALAGGGQTVTLMLDALQDFHYEVLHISLDKPTRGETRIVLELRGSNPAVLEGYPFVINITLTGDAAPLFEALTEGQRLSDQLLRTITQ